MAELGAPLWQYNFVKVIVVDVSDDYALMQPPMPSDFYPVLCETLLPVHNLSMRLEQSDLVPGFLYDWHEGPEGQDTSWYVGVVREDLAEKLLTEASVMTH
jgi:hypothetical protein